MANPLTITPPPATRMLLTIAQLGRLGSHLSDASGWLVDQPVNRELYSRSVALAVLIRQATAAGHRLVALDRADAAVVASLCRQAAMQLDPIGMPATARLAGTLTCAADVLNHRAETDQAGEVPR